MLKKGNELASVLYDIESDHNLAKYDRKNRDMETEYQKKNKSEQKHISYGKERLKRLDTCEVLVFSVLEFGMDHINSTKVKHLRVIIRYNFGSEKLKGIPNKVELVEVVKDLFINDWAILCRYGGSFA